MRLASARAGGRDGTLLVVSDDGKSARPVPEIASTLQQALENWPSTRPLLEAVSRQGPDGAKPLEPGQLAAPLPRTYQWLDGSAYLSHVERVRRARGAELPPELLTDPLMYQGSGDGMLAATDPICLVDETWGLDFEAEVGVITDDVPMGVTPDVAGRHICLLVLINDVSLRHLIPAELAKGFGFLHGKPASALSPFVVTPDELGAAWDGSRVHLPLRSHVNGACVGEPDAGVGMQFDFPTLISHAARTRNLCAGTLIGSGTVSNADASRGYSCLIERRVVEMVEIGQAHTPFLRHGDRVRIGMYDDTGRSIFGDIEQQVVPWPG